ncbi:type 2 lanthipeptide synthetase LanM family protein [Cyanobium sp. NIES-981]|uniref:type 2 lanthipeptide synthetase LanM family protein n=1 Tax=Cyanobium sp. NIES-981 TaxID=1851505 RepID=UPI0012F7DFB5|nr:type 2 lanthipeptide synthetase LanM family protein [Cyanobium sp. NIES-981]
MPLPFQDLWKPAVAALLSQLQDRVEGQSQQRITPTAWRGIGRTLLSRLCHLTEHVLWEDFHQQRGPGIMLLAHKQTPENGSITHHFYSGFVERKRQEGLETLLKRHPVLGRLLANALLLWEQASLEIILQINADRDCLETTFGIPKSAFITAIETGLGDPHRGGRSVTSIRFSDPPEHPGVIHKPRSLGLEEAYNALVDELNSRSRLPPLKTAKAVCRGDHGYMETIVQSPCKNDDELSRFYLNAGRLLAVLHLLGCTDGHHQNLIAHGDQLLLVDAETLLEPNVVDHTKQSTSLPEKSDLLRTLSSSVLRTGLLPSWSFHGEASTPVDISALGISPEVSDTRTVHGWIAINTDGMMRGPVREAIPWPSSLPVGPGAHNPLPRFRKVFVEGFRRQSELILARRNGLLAGTGAFHRLGGKTRRIVLRHTRVYESILEQCRQPAALASEQAQGLVLEALARSYLKAEEEPRHWPVFAAELAQLEQRDVPCFQHPTDETCLPLGHGMDPIEGFFKSSGLEACFERLQELSPDTIAFQCRLIEGALGARWMERPGMEQPTQRARRSSSGDLTAFPSRETVPRSHFAQQLCEQISDLAIRSSDGSLGWLDLVLGADRRTFCYGPLGMDLYGGCAGFVLLMACLSQAIDRHKEHMVRELMHPLADLALQGDPGVLHRWWRDQPLGLSGSGGIVLTLLELDRLQQPPPHGWSSYRQLALRLLHGLQNERIDADGVFDLMGGVAGLVGPLLQLREDCATELAIRAGRHLIRSQNAEGGWPPAHEGRSLLGFSHGTSGISAALAVLHHHLNLAGALEATERALNLETLNFCPALGNWPDLRLPESTSRFMVAWCHGAPGVVLSRLCMSQCGFGGESFQREWEAALDCTAAKPLASDHLCCGTMGLVVILRLAQRRQDADALEANVLARLNQGGGCHDLRGLVAGPLTSPGMMTGLSGIALGLLDSPESMSCLAQVMSGGLLDPGQ